MSNRLTEPARNKPNKMNSKIRMVLAGAASAAMCALALAVEPSSVSLSPPPAADAQVLGPAPSQGYVIMSGHWDSDGAQWKWVASHWELPPSRSATWVAGHWVSLAGNWVWVNGAWNIAGEQQAQAGPPRPPGQDAAAEQGVPMPSTPAPLVSGQYGPSGVSRVIDQPPVTTDYGPIDYSTDSYYPAYAYPGYAYPGYGWAGDPYYWGYPGIAFGLGWGPGFAGWGRGGYGYVGRGGYYGHGGYAHGGSFAHGGGFARGSSGHFGH
jgi:hypothetical protein